MKKTFIAILLLAAGLVKAQTPTPAKAQSNPIALKGATIHVGNGEIIENGTVGFDNGKITMVLKSGESADMSGYQIVDVNGQHIYPGFILPNSNLGLEEEAFGECMCTNLDCGNGAIRQRTQAQALLVLGLLDSGY